MRPNTNDTIILTAQVGSHAYGYATPSSDLDYMSVVLPDPEIYLGLGDWGKSGTMEDAYEDPQNGFVEHKYYEFKKYVGMCRQMNPNVIPTLWVDRPESVTQAGSMLLANRELFNSKHVYNTFSGYAHSQLQKMGGVFNDNEESNKLLKAGHQKFQEWADQEIFRQRSMRDYPVQWQDDVEEILSNVKTYDEGYLNALIALRTYSKEECKRIKDGPITGRMGAKRKELRDKYGYDTKFASHVIRLMRMCVEFLKHPEEGLKVCRTGIDANFLYSIRTGALTQEQVKEMADELFAEAKEALKTTSLPDEPDYNAINNLTVDILRMHLVPTRNGHSSFVISDEELASLSKDDIEFDLENVPRPSW